MTASDARPPESLDAWATTLRARFGLEPEDIPVELLTGLAQDVANGVSRPASLLGAYVAGLVAGRAGGSPDDVGAAVAAVAALAKGEA